MRHPEAVYEEPSGVYYIALFEDAGGPHWYRWPAERDGWRLRTHCASDLVDDAEEMPADRADLALRLSGVPIDD